ncbi:phosphatase [Candidatus Formimonas warabiya]|uniref:Phosphatase n=1 Tax=Formimonas warabiya TaxID=1761012 RepID=A0A3G1KUY3_FORW1|nr:phosphatase [Candidatus Formimonas warabiya]ATW26259.1 phosphatase [Candidatus Formimonas warabiya]
MYIRVDLHTHTIASGHAYSTVREMAQEAKMKGLEAIAITDHGLNFPGGPHEYYFANLTAIPRYLAEVEVLKGVEANIIEPSGKIDVPKYLLTGLDVVLAGFHEYCGYISGSVEENTDAMIGALNNPYVHFVSHPGNPDFPVDLEKIAYAASKLGKAIEINNSSFIHSRPGSDTRCRQFLGYAKNYQTLLVVNSDAHISTSVGEVGAALEAIVSTGIGPEQILNSSLERIRNYLNKQNASH